MGFSVKKIKKAIKKNPVGAVLNPGAVAAREMDKGLTKEVSKLSGGKLDPYLPPSGSFIPDIEGNKNVWRQLQGVVAPAAKQYAPVAGGLVGNYWGPWGAALGTYAGSKVAGQHGMAPVRNAALAYGASALSSYASGAGGAGGGTGSTGGGGALSSFFNRGSNIAPATAGGGGGAGGWLNTVQQWLPLANAATNYISGQRQAEAAEEAAEYADPFRDQRAQYQARLNALYADPSAIEREPGYQFELEQGTNAIDRILASQGRYFSGARPYELTKFAQGLAQTRFQDAVNRLSSLAGAQFAPGGGTEAMYTAAKDKGSNINKLIGDLTLLTGRPSPQLKAISGIEPSTSNIPTYTLGDENMGYRSALESRYM